MEIATDKGFSGIEVSIPFDGVPTVDDIMGIIRDGDESFIEDLNAAILDRVLNEWYLDTVSDAIRSANREVVAKYVTAVKSDKAWASAAQGCNFVPCIFDGEGLLAELLGNETLPKLLQVENCPFV